MPGPSPVALVVPGQVGVDWNGEPANAAARTVQSDAMSASGALLRVIVGHEVVREIPVHGALTIGRRGDNSVVLSDDSVSGHHGRIEPDGNGFRYVDVGSMNGSLVAAGPRLRSGQSVVLDDVTQIKIGRTVLEFRPGSEAPATPAQPPGPRIDSTTGCVLGPGLWGEHDRGAGLIHTPAVIPPLLQEEHERRAAARGAAARDPAHASPTADPDSEADADADADADARAAAAPPWRDDAPSSEAASTARRSSGARDEAASSAAPASARPRDAARARDVASASASSAASSAAPAGARLLAMVDGKPHSLVLGTDPVLLGRARGADLVLDHRSVSERHAQLTLVNGQWTARDLGSTNGTRLGVARLTEARPLPAVALLILGAVEVLFVQDGPHAPGAVVRPEPVALCAWLRRRGRLSRRETRLALRELRRDGGSIEEVLVRRGVLTPGAVTECVHAAASEDGASPHADRWPIWEWALMAALAAAVTYTLIG